MIVLYTHKLNIDSSKAAPYATYLNNTLKISHKHYFLILSPEYLNKLYANQKKWWIVLSTLKVMPLRIFKFGTTTLILSETPNFEYTI